MNILVISLVVLFASLVSGALVFLFLRGNKKSSSSDNSLLLIQNQLQDLRNTMDEKLGSSAKMLQQQFKDSTTIIKEVTEKLTRLDDTNKQVLNFSDQLKNLQDILKNPKQRGILGEYYLETVLKNVLPPGSYQMQYEFKDG